MNEHAAPRRVFRSRSDRVVAGVAGGFARYLGLDAAVVRLVLVVLAFVGGLGVLLYLAAWLVVPDEPAGTEVPEGPPLRHGARVGWTVVVAIVAIAVLAEVGHIGFGLRPGILWPLALIGFGIAVLWLRAGDGPATAAPAAPAWGTSTAPDPTVTGPGATTPSTSGTSSASSAAWSAGALPSSTATADPNAPSAPWRVAAVSPTPLRRAAPVLGRIAVAVFAAAVALVVTVGMVLLVEGPGGVDVTPAWAALVGVLVVLAAVVVGLRIRRVPDLVAVTVPVLFVLAVACWVGPPFRGGFGSRDVRPADAASLDRTYRLAGGTLVVDPESCTSTDGRAR
jgi:phage shock protein PspC (stress-responsive transcriptional regulator)